MEGIKSKEIIIGCSRLDVQRGIKLDMMFCEILIIKQDKKTS